MTTTLACPPPSPKKISLEPTTKLKTKDERQVNKSAAARLLSGKICEPAAGLGREARAAVVADGPVGTMRYFGSFSLHLDVQNFTGSGESLLGYKQKPDQLRVGPALFR